MTALVVVEIGVEGEKLLGGVASVIIKHVVQIAHDHDPSLHILS